MYYGALPWLTDMPTCATHNSQLSVAMGEIDRKRSVKRADAVFWLRAAQFNLPKKGKQAQLLLAFFDSHEATDVETTRTQHKYSQWCFVVLVPFCTRLQWQLICFLFLQVFLYCLLTTLKIVWVLNQTFHSRLQQASEIFCGRLIKNDFCVSEWDGLLNFHFPSTVHDQHTLWFVGGAIWLQKSDKSVSKVTGVFSPSTDGLA